MPEEQLIQSEPLPPLRQPQQPQPMASLQQQQQQQPQPPSPVSGMEIDTKIELPAKCTITDPAQLKYEEPEVRPFWMKIKKVSNKERRRRQNEHLRRLLIPKNAVMVLNEMMPKEQIICTATVEAVPPRHFNKPSTGQIFCVQLTICGEVYKGYGENKLVARNAAADLALREIMIKKMSKLNCPDATAAEATGGAAESGAWTEGGAAEAEAETLPMIQLASYALHKLFAQWELQGVKVPLLRPPHATAPEAEGGDATASGGEGGPTPAKVKKVKVLPDNASSMHPCMLLTYMRPSLEYRDVCAEGDRPQNMLFTVALDVDGETYIGKASNKREARKAAARSACFALFGLEFESTAADNVPRFNTPSLDTAQCATATV